MTGPLPNVMQRAAGAGSPLGARQSGSRNIACWCRPTSLSDCHLGTHMTGKRAKPGLIAATHTTDAIVLLRSDMETVAGLFRQLENCRSAAEKKPIVKQICVALSVRAQLEEEILYPALTRALNDRDLLYRSHLQRTALRALIAEVEDIEPDDDYDTNLA